MNSFFSNLWVNFVKKREHFTNLSVTVTAVAVWGAAFCHPMKVPLLLLFVGFCVAYISQKKGLFFLLLIVFSSTLSDHAIEGYVPVIPGRFEGKIELLDDPEVFLSGSGSHVLGKIQTEGSEQNKVIDLVAFGEPGYKIFDSSAGESVHVRGQLSEGKPSAWARSKQIAGSLSVERVVSAEPLSGWRRFPEFFRDRIIESSQYLPEKQRPLYLGLVIGEDRGQGLAQTAQFKEVGISHILAVSGQNVVLVLAFFSPIVRLFPRRSRVVISSLVLLAFLFMTRMEPSVLRASVVAAISLFAALQGARRSGIRILSLAVIGLVLWDPFLVYSVGFTLSVIASAGIILFSRKFQQASFLQWLWAPLREVLGVTLAAQVVVAPFLIFFFDSFSSVSILSNILVGFPASVVMMGGFFLGVLIGVVPDFLFVFFVHIVQLFLWWIAEVTAVLARWTVPQISIFPFVVLFFLSLAWYFSPHRWVWPVRSVYIGSISVALYAGTFLNVSEISVSQSFYIAQSAGSPSILILQQGSSPKIIEEVVQSKIKKVDIVLLEKGGRYEAELVHELREVISIETVFAPPQHQVAGALRVLQPFLVKTKNGTILIQPEEKMLRISSLPADSATFDM